MCKKKKESQFVSFEKYILFKTVYLSTSFFICILMLNAVNFYAVTLQGTPLREALLAQIALIRSHARVRPCMPLEVERVVEALAAKCAEITLHVAVTLHVTIEKPLQIEIFAADAASEAVILLTRKSCVTISV